MQLSTAIIAGNPNSWRASPHNVYFQDSRFADGLGGKGFMKVVEWILGNRNDSQGWVDEQFLQVACDVIAVELDWDSLYSGCLHRATSSAKTPTGSPVIVGVLGQPDRISELLKDAEQERTYNGLPDDTPLWLYVPADLLLPRVPPETVVLKRLQ